jgi:DNA-binding transcriptional ArsR family regulator
MMFTTGKLTEAVAEALGLGAHIKTIDVHLRNLREAGLIAKAKRGRGAAEMGTMDAANLLIAVAGSEFTKDSVASVEAFGELRLDPSSCTIQGFPKPDFDPRHFLPLADPSPTFSSVLQKLFVLLGTGGFFNDELRESVLRNSGKKTGPGTEYLFATLYMPGRAAMIQYGARRAYHVQMVYGSLPVKDPRGAWDLRNFETDGSLITLRVIDRRALVRIATAVT